MNKNDLLAIDQTDKFEKDIVQNHFDKTDRKILKLILSQIKGNEENYLFDFKELENLGFDLQTNEKELFNSLKKIASYYISIQNGDGDMHQLGLIHNKFTIDKEMKILSLKVHKELVPFLNGLKHQYSFKQIEE